MNPHTCIWVKFFCKEIIQPTCLYAGIHQTRLRIKHSVRYKRFILKLVRIRPNGQHDALAPFNLYLASYYEQVAHFV